MHPQTLIIAGAPARGRDTERGFGGRLHAPRRWRAYTSIARGSAAGFATDRSCLLERFTTHRLCHRVALPIRCGVFPSNSKRKPEQETSFDTAGSAHPHGER